MFPGERPPHLRFLVQVRDADVVLTLQLALRGVSSARSWWAQVGVSTLWFGVEVWHTKSGHAFLWLGRLDGAVVDKQQRDSLLMPECSAEGFCF